MLHQNRHRSQLEKGELAAFDSPKIVSARLSLSRRTKAGMLADDGSKLLVGGDGRHLPIFTAQKSPERCTKMTSSSFGEGI